MAGRKARRDALAGHPVAAGPARGSPARGAATSPRSRDGGSAPPPDRIARSSACSPRSASIPRATASRSVRCPARSIRTRRSAWSPPRRSSAASSTASGPTRSAARPPCGVGSGKVIADVRRGDGPPAAGRYTFAALATTEALIAREPERVAAAVRAIVRTQRVLKKDPGASDRGRPPAIPARGGGDHRRPRRARSPLLRSRHPRGRGDDHERLRAGDRAAGGAGHLRRRRRDALPRSLGDSILIRATMRAIPTT